ncbi:MAG: DinB family protein [Saprospiraceae bacterium]|nr:DinB family protein [Saprospiraceae bacterium]
MEVHPDLKNAIKAWEIAWQEIHNHISSLDQEQLLQIPVDGGWTIQQIIQHLNLSERLSLQYVRRKTSNPGELRRAGVASYLRLQLLHISLASPIRFKAPALVSNSRLPDGETFEETLSQLSISHIELRELAKEVAPLLAKKEVFKHPFAGKLPLAGMFWFFTWHLRHHQRQINRNLKESHNVSRQGHQQ